MKHNYSFWDCVSKSLMTQPGSIENLSVISIELSTQNSYLALRRNFDSIAFTKTYHNKAKLPPKVNPAMISAG